MTASDSSPTSAPRRRAPSRLAGLWAKVSLLLLSVVGALVVAETLSYPILGASPNPIENRFPVEDTRHPRPYSMFGGRQTADNRDFQNDLGYRGQRPGAEKALGELRIFVLGGSTVYWGDPPIPTLLEQHFHRQRLDHVQVYNFGCVSQGSGMELARVVYEILPWQPDLVIFYDGINDILSPTYGDPRPGYPYNFPVYENNPLLTTHDSLTRMGLMLLAKSNLVQHLGHQWLDRRLLPLERLYQEAGAGTAQWKQEICDRYVENLVKAQAITRALGGEFLAVLQPSGFLKKHLRPDEYASDVLEPGLRAHVPQVAELIRQAAQAEIERGRLNFVDLSLIFRDTQERRFTDSMHVTQEANEILAEEIHSRLAEFAGSHPRLSRQLGSPGKLADLDGALAWQLFVQPPAQAKLLPLADPAGGLRIACGAVEAQPPHAVQLVRRLLPLTAGQKMQVRLKIKADADCNVQVAVTPYTNLARPTGQEQTIAVTTELTEWELEFVAPDKAQDDLALEFQLGDSTAAVEIVEVQVEYEPVEYVAPASPAEASSAIPRWPTQRRAIERYKRRIFVWDAPIGAGKFSFPGGPGGPMRIEMNPDGENLDHVHLAYPQGMLQAGEKVRVELGLRADAPVTLNCGMVRADGQPGSYGIGGELNLTRDWKAFEFEGTAPFAAEANFTLFLPPQFPPVEISLQRHFGGPGLPLTVRSRRSDMPP